jgi:hypothetical protein
MFACLLLALQRDRSPVGQGIEVIERARITVGGPAIGVNLDVTLAEKLSNDELAAFAGRINLFWYGQ